MPTGTVAGVPSVSASRRVILSAVPGRPRLTGATACIALVVASAIGRSFASWGVAAPWIAPDEPTYGMLGRSLWHTGRLTMLGVEGPFYGIVYPALAGLPLTVLGLTDGVRVLPILQAAVMSTAGLLVYAWARRLVSPRFALVATALTLAVPAFTYTGLIMTEVAFYPIATLALLMMARALEEPALERQAFAVVAILLASLTRLQGLVLLPVLVTAIVVAALFERSARLLRSFALTLVLLSIAGALLIGFHESGSHDLLGAYTTTARTSYQVGPALRWIVWHAGDLFLLVAGAPLLAAVVLAVDAARGRERSPAVRALLAVSISYATWSVVQVGVFASRFSDSLLERNVITLAPPLFIVFALWLERGLPRPQPVTFVACSLAIAPAVALPASRLTDPGAAPQAFTPLALSHLLDWTSLGWTRAVWIAGVLAMTTLFLAVPRRLAWTLPAVMLAILAGASAVASSDTHRLARDLQDGLFGSSGPRWIDGTADGPVTYLYDGSFYWNGVWITAFWNARIERVVALPGPRPGALPPHSSTVSPRFDGQLFSPDGQHVDTPYVVTTGRVALVGKPVRALVQAIDGVTLTLWKVDPPARLRILRTGFQPNGDVSGHAEIDVFACGPGALNVTLLGKDGSPVTLGGPGIPPRTAAPAPRVGVNVVLPAPAAATGSTRCTFTLDTPGLVGTTVISFVPAG